MLYAPIECRLTIEELHERCAEWQKILRLQDWTIHLEIIPSTDIDGSRCRCYITPELAHATIRLSHPDSLDVSIEPYDMEQGLVHELCHVSTENVGGPEEITHEQERGIELISRALVGLKRAAGGIK
jgi:hypothetical protein